MKTNTGKKLYEAPELTQIPLDNDISLALSSTTPPTEPWGSDSHYEPSNSFKLPVA